MATASSTTCDALKPHAVALALRPDVGSPRHDRLSQDRAEGSSFGTWPRSSD
jgi:hypothetical protein